MKRFGNSNKGYTLVELLVAMAILVIMLMEVYSVMANSSTIYRKGNYEVQLQTEAQQVVQQLEDLMADCNGSIEFVSANKTLTISNNELNPATGTKTAVKYIINYNAPDPAHGVYFGSLSYNKTVSGGSLTSGIPFADYIDDFYVDMSTYDNDNVTIYVKVANEDYSYTVAEDVYLRNEIGSGGTGEADDTTDAKQFLDVKRYATYNLDKLFDKTEDGKKYDYNDFYFKDATTGSKKTSVTEYAISGKELTVLASYRDVTNKEFGPYMIYATGTITDLATGTVTTIDDDHALKISAHTDEVSWGFNDYSIYYIPSVEPSYAVTGLTEFKGISLADADTVTYSYMILSADHYHYKDDSDGTRLHQLSTATKKKTNTGTAPSSQGSDSTVIFYNEATNINGDGKWRFYQDGSTTEHQYDVSLPPLRNYVDATSNAIVTYNNKATWNVSRSDEYINTTDSVLSNGHKFYIQVDVKWKSPDLTKSFKIYLYPINRTLTDDEKALLDAQLN